MLNKRPAAGANRTYRAATPPPVSVPDPGLDMLMDELERLTGHLPSGRGDVEILLAQQACILDRMFNMLVAGGIDSDEINLLNYAFRAQDNCRHTCIEKYADLIKKSPERTIGFKK